MHVYEKYIHFTLLIYQIFMLNLFIENENYYLIIDSNQNISS